jgi:hypothetical protein
LKDETMHPLQVAAQFAAFTWYSEANPDAEQEDAAWFARTSWSDFLPVAHEGLGRLLLKIAGEPGGGKRGKRRHSSRQAHAAVA